MLGAQGIIVDVEAKSAGADDGEHTRITPRDEAAEYGDAAATFETDTAGRDGPYVIAAHAGVGSGLLAKARVASPIIVLLSNFFFLFLPPFS